MSGADHHAEWQTIESAISINHDGVSHRADKKHGSTLY
jgi:hypothetical protein